MTVLVEVIGYIWGLVNPAFVPIADYCVLIPLVLWMLKLTAWAVGKPVVEKALKIWKILMSWINLLSVGIFFFGVIVHLINSTHELHLETYTDPANSLMRNIMVICASTSCITMITTFVLSLLSRKADISVTPVQEVEAPDKRIEEILEYLKRNSSARTLSLEALVPTRGNSQERTTAEGISSSRTVAATPTYTAVVSEDTPMTEARPIPYHMRPCYRCGETGHRSFQCPFIKEICSKCGLRGHKGEVCQHAAHRDRGGRIITRIENRPGSIKMVQRKDRTQGDAISTGQSVISRLSQALNEKTRKEKERRELRKLAKELLGATEEPGTTPTTEKETKEDSESSRKRTKSSDDVLLLANRFEQLLSPDEEDF